MIGYRDFIACYTDMEAVQFRPAFTLLLSLFSGAEVGHDLEGWAPTFELDLPVHEDCCWDYYQVGTPYALLDCEMGEKSDCLDCFS